ncbi:hypothetical protein [Sinomonas sp. P47F7]|uniref:hypothetical protein n=1 Tax=Sinomonas sp. P47F7 TaxID=3410987 RepID=UPI003BF554BB
MPPWAGALLGAGLVAAAVGAVAGSIVINDRDSAIISAWAEALIIAWAVFAGTFGALLFWRAGERVALTRDAAIVTKGFAVRARIDRRQLEGFHPYLHQYTARGGDQYRMVPTFTVGDSYGRLREVPLPFLSYWNPVGGTLAPLPPRAAYIEAWARGANSPFSRSTSAGAIPAPLSMHQQFVRTGLQRRARLAAALIPLLTISLGLGLGFGFGPVAQALGLSRRSVDTQTDRAGIRDLDDSLTPVVTTWDWHALEVTPGTRSFTFNPTLRSLPPEGHYTVRYFIRDPAQRGSNLSLPQQKYGRIVSQGTISVTDPMIEFTLDNNDTLFTFEIYVSDDQGHTTRDGTQYRNIGPRPAPTPTPHPAPIQTS